MYPNAPTEMERLLKIIEDGKMTIEDVIQDYIEKHDTSQMLEGVDYYFKKNLITERVIYKYDNAGNKLIDTEATNNRLASGWHKLLVDQKTSYLVGDPVTISSKTDKDIAPVIDVLGDGFDDTLTELVKNASNKGKEWIHVFIDEDGAFDYIIVPAQEVIPIYDDSKRKTLLAAIRYYEVDDGTVKIEFWDDQQVTYYEIIDGKVHLAALEEVNPASHFYYGEKGYGWNKVPFIEFANNEERVGDIIFYKDFVDAYDKLMSDTTNTLEDIQELFYVLKGYEDTNLAEFSTNLKRYKGVKVSEDGGVDSLQAEVPIDSVDKHLDRLIENIYQFGQGVNTNTDSFGNSPSGIALKFLFTLLDMKAGVLERKFTKSLKRFMWFVCEYLLIAEKQQFDYQDISYTFNKSMLMNDFEQVQIAQMSKGVISDETIISNHPWVTNTHEELKRLEAQEKDSLEKMNSFNFKKPGEE